MRSKSKRATLLVGRLFVVFFVLGRGQAIDMLWHDVLMTFFFFFRVSFYFYLLPLRPSKGTIFLLSSRGIQEELSLRWSKSCNKDWQDTGRVCGDLLGAS